MGVDVTNLGSDQGQMAPMTEQLQGRYGVRTIDSTRGSLVLEYVGPWVAKTESPITPRTVIVSPATEYFVADRATDGATGYPGDYVETKAQFSDVKVGAFVSVECQRDGGRCTALKLVVVRLSPP